MIGELINGLEKESMFSNYQLRNKTRYSHLEENKKLRKRVKKATVETRRPKLKPTIINL